jgi:hypothetical protein
MELWNPYIRSLGLCFKGKGIGVYACDKLRRSCGSEACLDRG